MAKRAKKRPAAGNKSAGSKTAGSKAASGSGKAKRKTPAAKPQRATGRPVRASLAPYRAKRDFHTTSEPAGNVAVRPGGNRFCVQKHDASHLHYDFRLELDGVLKSWAVPKGPSLDPADKRLAIHVEDHPLDYGDFEGTIPQGEYGGGTVMLWDRGRWTSPEDARAGYRNGRLKFSLAGEKLAGGWMLVRRGGRSAAPDEKNWFLIKEHDAFARTHAELDVTEERTLSVKTGRDLDEISDGRKTVWKSSRAAKTAHRPKAVRAVKAAGRAQGPAALRSKRAKLRGKKSKAARAGAGEASAGPRAALPDFVQPQLATLVKTAPVGDGWLHEIKFDGYRMLLRVANGRAQFISRNGQDWTGRFGALADAAARLPVRQALVDGEVVVLQPDGTTSFQALQNVLSEGTTGELLYLAFDLLHLDGRDLAGLPLEQRKRLLESVIVETDRGPLRYVEHIVGSGQTFFEHACRRGLEGIISKRSGQPYRSGRGEGWVKTKCQQRDEFVIVGYTDPAGARTGFGALLLGYHDARGELVYAGKVGTGFSEQSLESLTARLRSLSRSRSPLATPAPAAAVRRAHWVAPKLVAQIEFTQWTRDGMLRHPAFQGLREDKPAAEVVRDRAKPPPALGHNGHAHSSFNGRPRETMAKRNSKSAAAEPVAAGVRITHPERVLYPDVGLTKIDVARYYEHVAEWLLPHVAGRPLTFVRCPEGNGKPCFYQKHVATGLPASVGQVEIREKNKTDTYRVIRDASGLVSLVQFGVLEIHVWGARADDVERPDRLVFDLDPDPSVAWKAVVRAARMLRERLSDMGLESFVKTTGGKGLHVVLPIRRRDPWPAMKLFCHRFVDAVVADAPDEFTGNMSKAARSGKIFIDYLRNERGATSIAAYSTRARAGAPVSVPLTWDELGPKIQGDHFTVTNVPARLAKLRTDPWAGIDAVRQSITAKMKKAVGM